MQNENGHGSIAQLKFAKRLYTFIYFQDLLKNIDGKKVYRIDL